MTLSHSCCTITLLSCLTLTGCGGGSDAGGQTSTNNSSSQENAAVSITSKSTLPIYSASAISVAVDEIKTSKIQINKSGRSTSNTLDETIMCARGGTLHLIVTSTDQKHLLNGVFDSDEGYQATFDECVTERAVKLNGDISLQVNQYSAGTGTYHITLGSPDSGTMFSASTVLASQGQIQLGGKINASDENRLDTSETGSILSSYSTEELKSKILDHYQTEIISSNTLGNWSFLSYFSTGNLTSSDYTGKTESSITNTKTQSTENITTETTSNVQIDSNTQYISQGEWVTSINNKKITISIMNGQINIHIDNNGTSSNEDYIKKSSEFFKEILLSLTA